MSQSTNTDTNTNIDTDSCRYVKGRSFPIFKNGHEIGYEGYDIEGNTFREYTPEYKEEFANQEEDWAYHDEMVQRTEDDAITEKKIVEIGNYVDKRRYYEIGKSIGCEMEDLTHEDWYHIHELGYTERDIKECVSYENYIRDDMLYIEVDSEQDWREYFRNGGADSGEVPPVPPVNKLELFLWKKGYDNALKP